MSLITKVILTVFACLSFVLVQAEDSPADTIKKQAFKSMMVDYYKDPAGLIKNDDILPYAEEKYINAMYKLFKMNAQQYAENVVLTADSLPKAKGKSNKALSVVAMRAGKLIQIPYQIDEFSDRGLIYIKGESEGLGHDLAGKAGKFDAQDELVFMLRDAGTDTIPEDKLASVNILQHLEFTVPDGPNRYAYVVESSDLNASSADYISVDINTGRINSTIYGAKMDKDNFLDLKSAYSKIGRAHGLSFVEEFRLEMSAGIFSESIRVTLDNKNNIVADPVGIKQGPIRDLVLFKIRIKNLGVTLYAMPAQMAFYEQKLTGSVSLEISSLKWASYFISAVKRPEALFSVKMKHIDQGSLTFPPLLSYGKAVFDGKTNAFEKKIDDIRFPSNWVFFDSGQLWSMFVPIPVKSGGINDQLLSDIELGVLYKEVMEDDQRKLIVGGELTGFPEILLAFIDVMSDSDISKDDPLGTLLWEAVETGDNENSQRMTKVLKEHLLALQAKGLFDSPSEMLEVLNEELSIIQFSGFDKDLISRTAKASIAGLSSFEDFDYYQAQVLAKEYLQSQGYDENFMPYVQLSNSVHMTSILSELTPENYYKSIGKLYQAIIK